MHRLRPLMKRAKRFIGHPQANSGLLEVLDRFDNLLAVLGSVDLIVDHGDLAGLVDHEGPAGRSHTADEIMEVAILVLVFEGSTFVERHAELLGNAAVLVRQEGEGELVDLLE